jgi:very-short-patch-repair endonuclease
VSKKLFNENCWGKMDLENQILSILMENSGLKARDIADKIGCDKRAVNSLLYSRLRGQVFQDRAYRWYLKDKKSQTSQPQASRASKPDTELNRLCRYYLDCLSYDVDQGISTFAQNRYGQPDYIELAAMPLVDDEYNWMGVEGVGGYLGKVRRERGRSVMYLGYPTRLRFHRTQRWEGFFIEPLFLFPVDIPVGEPGATPEISTELPIVNFRALKNLTEIGSANVLEEAVELADALGLSNPHEDQPDIDELFPKLPEIRPEWDWREPIDPYSISIGQSLAEIDNQGIYNRPIVVVGERSPYTKGLETELKKLSELEESTLTHTVLGVWLKGHVQDAKTSETQPLIEVLPLNLEQREAVKRAMTESLTVITGPPGTGKSQVVTALLVIAAWTGQKVLFASKNNKAVDVVESRVNGLGSRPILLRLGSNEYQGKLASYLTGLLGATSTQDDKVSFDENLAIHEKLVAHYQKLQKQVDETMTARNTVDRLDRKIVEFREILPFEAFVSWRNSDVNSVEVEFDRFKTALQNAIQSKQGFISRMFWKTIAKGRFEKLKNISRDLESTYSRLLLKPPAQIPSDATIGLWEKFLEAFDKRVQVVKQIGEYFHALNILKSQPALEVLAKRQMELNEKLASNSQRLWQDWIKLQPSRLSSDDRQLIGNYAAVLQMIVDSRGTNQRLPRRVFAEYYKLLPQISHLMPCWAVTSLSANGKVPFEGGIFALLVIDEASQCDIASALPLLFRAKRAVIIGDPKQLPHISTLNPNRDAQMQEKHGIVEGRGAWMYSVNSLFHLAASMAKPEDLIDLRDHHRSHADIIGFSNQFFYEGKLRIATAYDRLKLPQRNEPVVQWVNVPGQVERPTTGGAVNKVEAKAVVDFLKDLVLRREYLGTIGAVSPFRAQANLIRKMAFSYETLSLKLQQAEFIADTVHKFQGDERDVMVFSPVVSNGITPGAVSFLKHNGNLFNVAITRARAMLQVVGDNHAAIHSGIEYLAEFAKYAQSIGLQGAEPREKENHTDLGPEYPNVARPELVSEWEKIFYHQLYAAGIRTIPQYNVEQYVLDFALINGESRLNIEIDGERYHRDWNGELCRRDQIRNQRMIELGWEVKRFWVYQIRDEMQQCVDWVKDWLNN